MPSGAEAPALPDTAAPAPPAAAAPAPADMNAPLIAYALDTNTAVWTSNLQTDADLVAGGGLILAPHAGALDALDQATGKLLWSTTVGTLPVPPTWRAGWIFLADAEGGVSALRASDGFRVWHQSLGAKASAPPAVDGDRLVVPLADGRLTVLDITGKGRVEWTRPLGAAPGAPLAANGRVYVGTAAGEFFAFPQAGADRPDWSFTRIRETVVGLPVASGDNVYIATHANRVLALDRNSGAVRWSQGVTTRPGAQPLVEHGQVIVPLDSGAMTVLAVKDGKIVLQIPPPKPIEGTRLASPVALSGPPADPHLACLTLGADGVYSVSVYARRPVPKPAAPVTPGAETASPTAPPANAAPAPTTAPATTPESKAPATPK